eukprot:6890299-Lingulodinium_polyedra.AAC.1
MPRARSVHIQKHRRTPSPGPRQNWRPPPSPTPSPARPGDFARRRRGQWQTGRTADASTYPRNNATTPTSTQT